LKTPAADEILTIEPRPAFQHPRQERSDWSGASILHSNRMKNSPSAWSIQHGADDARSRRHWIIILHADAFCHRLSPAALSRTIEFFDIGQDVLASTASLLFGRCRWRKRLRLLVQGQGTGEVPDSHLHRRIRIAFASGGPHVFLRFVHSTVKKKMPGLVPATPRFLRSVSTKDVDASTGPALTNVGVMGVPRHADVPRWSRYLVANSSTAQVGFLARHCRGKLPAKPGVWFFGYGKPAHLAPPPSGRRSFASNSSAEMDVAQTKPLLRSGRTRSPVLNHCKDAVGGGCRVRR